MQCFTVSYWGVNFAIFVNSPPQVVRSFLQSSTRSKIGNSHKPFSLSISVLSMVLYNALFLNILRQQMFVLRVLSLSYLCIFNALINFHKKNVCFLSQISKLRSLRIYIPLNKRHKFIYRIKIYTMYKDIYNVQKNWKESNSKNHK